MSLYDALQLSTPIFIYIQQDPMGYYSMEVLSEYTYFDLGKCYGIDTHTILHESEIIKLVYKYIPLQKSRCPMQLIMERQFRSFFNWPLLMLQ